VQAIAHEISEELGPEALLAGARRSAERELTTVPAPAVGASDDAAVWRGHFRDIDERLARLEKTLSSAIRLLQRLLEPDRVSKPRTPIGR
jgi:hypothetical protein